MPDVIGGTRLPTGTTPGSDRRAHAYYRTALAPPVALGVGQENAYRPVFAQEVFDPVVPDGYDGTPPWYDPATGLVKNPDGRLFLVRVTLAYRYDRPTATQAATFGETRLGVTMPKGLGGLLNLTASVNLVQIAAISAAMSTAVVRRKYDLDGPGQGPLDEITPRDTAVPFGSTDDLDFHATSTDVFFGGENMRTFGMGLDLYLPEPVAAPAHFVRGELLIVDLSAADELTTGT